MTKTDTTTTATVTTRFIRHNVVDNPTPAQRAALDECRAAHRRLEEIKRTNPDGKSRMTAWEWFHEKGRVAMGLGMEKAVDHWTREAHVGNNERKNE